MKTNKSELPFNCRNNKMTSKPDVDVNPGLAWSKPAYESSGVRHRGSVSAIRALMLNCGNLHVFQLAYKDKPGYVLLQVVWKNK